MGIQTNYLKLIKPMAGSTGWGEAINQNWDKIDREYAKLQNNLAVIQGRMVDIGTFGFLSYTHDNQIVDVDYMMPVQCIVRIEDDYYEVTPENLKTVDNGKGQLYYYWHIDPNSSKSSLPSNALLNNYGMAYLGSERIRDNGSRYFVRDAQQYTEYYYNDDNNDHQQFSSIADFTAFYLHVPFYCYMETQDIEDLNSVNSIYIYGLELYFDGILIKTSRLIDNKYTTLLNKFKQALGGYYAPRSTPDSPNTIIFEKTAASSGTQKIEYFIPRSVANSTETVYCFQRGAENLITIGTNIKTGEETINGNSITYSQNIANVNFFLMNDTARVPIIVPYRLEYHDNNGWEIQVDPSYLSEGVDYYASWVMLAPDITNLT